MRIVNYFWDGKLLCGKNDLKIRHDLRKGKIPTYTWLSRRKRASNSISYEDEWIFLPGKKCLANDETLMYACQWRPDPRRCDARGGHELYER